MRVSVIIPAFNEQENIQPLHGELTETLRRGAFTDYEIIFVDDASTDATAARVQALDDAKVRLVRMPARSGQSFAQREGFRSARFEIIATLNADREEDPSDLNPMAALLNQGWDFVQGRRPARNDNVTRRFGAHFANSVRRAVLADGFADIGCNFRLFRRHCVDTVRLFNGAHRFLPYLVSRKGFRVTEVDVRHRPRAAGQSKYGLMDSGIKALIDLMRVRFTV